MLLKYKSFLGAFAALVDVNQYLTYTGNENVECFQSIEDFVVFFKLSSKYINHYLQAFKQYIILVISSTYIIYIYICIVHVQCTYWSLIKYIFLHSTFSCS